MVGIVEPETAAIKIAVSHLPSEAHIKSQELKSLVNIALCLSCRRTHPTNIPPPPPAAYHLQASQSAYLNRWLI